MPSARFALRFLLPAELLLGLFTISWGLAGAVGSGRLMQAVAALGGAQAWAWMLCGAGAFQVAVAAAELLWGRDWADSGIARSADLRHFAAFLALVCWLVVIGAYILHAPMRPAVALAMQALIIVPFQTFLVIHNKRLWALLHPSVPTNELRERLIAERVVRG
jgi:hypothetical protein